MGRPMQGPDIGGMVSHYMAKKLLRLTILHLTFYARTAYTGAVSFLDHAACSGSPRDIVIPGTFGPGVDIHDY